MAMTFENPYPKSWKYALKGNLHTHTTVSDGSRSMQDTVDDYSSRWYDWLMISDHDRYGDQTGLDPKRLILVPGVEVSANGPHMLQVGVPEPIEPSADRQEVIDGIKAVGGLSICNHPNWLSDYNHFPHPLLEQLCGYSGIEIFNGCIKRLPGSPLASDRFDRLLTLGKRIFAHAVDDSHKPSDVGNGWDVVFVNEKSRGAIVEALKKGAFYASSGVIIDHIAVTGDILHVASSNAEKMVVVTDGGVIADEKWGGEIIFKLTPGIETYVRVECYGRGDTMAWTQPFYVKGNPFSEPVTEQIQLVAQGPVLKGDLSDPVWKTSTRLGGFTEIEKARNAIVGTEAFVIADPDTVFIGFKFDEPEMDKIKAQSPDSNLMKLYTDDSAEIFIDPEGKGRKYYHVIVNSKGVYGGAIGREGEWLPELPTAVSKSDSGWTVEVAIPAKSLGLDKITKGMEWGMNLARNRSAGARSTCSWAYVGKDFHRPSRFGRVTFIGS